MNFFNPECFLGAIHYAKMSSALPQRRKSADPQQLNKSHKVLENRASGKLWKPPAPPWPRRIPYKKTTWDKCLSKLFWKVCRTGGSTFPDLIVLSSNFYFLMLFFPSSLLCVVPNQAQWPYRYYQHFKWLCNTYMSPYTRSQMMHVPSRLAVTPSLSFLLILMQDTAPLCSFRISLSFWVFSPIFQILTWKSATNICSGTSWSWLSSGGAFLNSAFLFQHIQQLSPNRLHLPVGYSCSWPVKLNWVLQSIKSTWFRNSRPPTPDLVFAKFLLSHVSFYTSLDQEKTPSPWSIASGALKIKAQSFCNGI